MKKRLPQAADRFITRNPWRTLADTRAPIHSKTPRLPSIKIQTNFSLKTPFYRAKRENNAITDFPLKTLFCPMKYGVQR
jgi:hypothetical protein